MYIQSLWCTQCLQFSLRFPSLNKPKTPRSSVAHPQLCWYTMYLFLWMGQHPVLRAESFFSFIIHSLIYGFIMSVLRPLSSLFWIGLLSPYGSPPLGPVRRVPCIDSKQFHVIWHGALPVLARSATGCWPVHKQRYTNVIVGVICLFIDGNLRLNCRHCVHQRDYI